MKYTQKSRCNIHNLPETRARILHYTATGKRRIKKQNASTIGIVSQPENR